MPVGEKRVERKSVGLLPGGRASSGSFVWRVFKGWEFRGALRGGSQ